MSRVASIADNIRDVALARACRAQGVGVNGGIRIGDFHHIGSGASDNIGAVNIIVIRIPVSCIDWSGQVCNRSNPIGMMTGVARRAKTLRKLKIHATQDVGQQIFTTHKLIMELANKYQTGCIGIVIQPVDQVGG